MIPTWRAMVAGLGGLATALAVPVVLAAQAQTEFVPADTLPREVLPATPFVLVAYGVVWVALLGYIYLLWRRVGRVEQELADVRAKIRDGGTRAG
jgi:CcmD family protein